VVEVMSRVLKKRKKIAAEAVAFTNKDLAGLSGRTACRRRYKVISKTTGITILLIYWKKASFY